MAEQFANHPGTVLSAAITSTTRPVTFSVASVANLPTQGNFRVLIDAEIFLITSISGTTLTGSNVEGTTAATHVSGTNVLHILTAGAIAQLETDAGNALLANGGTFGGSVGFSNPANIAFGSGWQGPWTMTYSGSGSMTVTQATLAQALYLRIGPLVFFELYVVLNLGGSASSQITISLPVASVGNINSVSCSVLNGGSFVAACAWVNAGAATLNVQLSGQPNFNVSSQAYVLASGFYRCA